MSALGIRTSADAYRVAVAELPLSARLTDPAADGAAVVVVAGAGKWWRAVADAFSEGAAGVVVSRPNPAPADALEQLAEIERPIVFERPLLRADAALELTQALPELDGHSVLTVECHASSLEPVLRDAIGWARVLGSAPLTVRTASFRGDRGLALLETAAGVPVSLVAGAQPEGRADGRIRVTALGGVLIELDGASGELSQTVTDAAACRTAPTLFERPERLALRRAIEAVTAGTMPADLAELRHDETLAATLLATSVS